MLTHGSRAPLADQRRHPLAHLVGGLVGEGHREHAFAARRCAPPSGGRYDRSARAFCPNRRRPESGSGRRAASTASRCAGFRSSRFNDGILCGRTAGADPVSSTYRFITYRHRTSADQTAQRKFAELILRTTADRTVIHDGQLRSARQVLSQGAGAGLPSRAAFKIEELIARFKLAARRARRRPRVRSRRMARDSGASRRSRREGSSASISSNVPRRRSHRDHRRHP